MKYIVGNQKEIIHFLGKKYILKKTLCNLELKKSSLKGKKKLFSIVFCLSYCSVIFFVVKLLAFLEDN